MSFLQSRYSTFVILFLATMLFMFLAYILSVGFAVLVSMVAVLFAYFGAPLWRSSGDPQSRVRMLALTLLASATAPILSPSWFSGVVNRIVSAINNSLNLNIPDMSAGQTGFAQLSVYLVVTASVVIVATRYPRVTIMTQKKSDATLGHDKSFGERFAKFVPLWAARLDGIDRELNWTDQDFVSLEAEVETKSKRSWGRNVSLLIDALKDVAKTQSADRPVIILGEPGSGKSVALRRLCRTLLQESQATGRLPVYINLKGWDSPSSWTSETKPSTTELQDFVRSAILSEANDFFAERFIEDYYDQMIMEGRFFFIFDSFDEIPLVMDSPENSWAIDAVSKCLNNFLQGAHSSQGIVASRYFKKPTDALGAGTIYRIRPFDETRVRDILRSVGGQNEADILDAFRTKAAVLRSATNPMIANLLASYVRERNGNWPNNTFQLYRDYIDRRLEDPVADQRMKDLGVNRSDVVNVSSKIAQFMIDADSNALDVTLEELAELGNVKKTASTVEVLRFIRLGRLTSSDAPTFSFSHRRFQEFFVVSSMTSEQVDLALNAIQSDNRYRDILALYCETATSDSMNHVASHAMSLLESIKESDVHGDVEALRSAVQVLRFISDAFKTRSDLSHEFGNALVIYITPILSRRSGKKFNPLLAKFSAESLGVLPDFGTAGPLHFALEYPNQYVRETSFRASRHIIPTPKPLKEFIGHEIVQRRYQSLTGIKLLRQYRDLMFSLNLSSGLLREKFVLFGWALDTLFLPLTLVLWVCALPIPSIIYIFTLSRVTKGHRTTKWLWASRFLSCFFILLLCMPIFLVTAAYLQIQGVSWEQFPEDETFRQIFTFPLPLDFARDLTAELPKFISAPLVFVLMINVVFPVAPIVLSKAWDLFHRERVERKPKSDRPKPVTLKDIRESWATSREAARKWKLENPPRESTPLTLGNYLGILVGSIILLAAIFVAIKFGLSVAVTFLGLVLLLLLFVNITPSVLGLISHSVRSAMDDAAILSKTEFPDRMNREKIEDVLSSLALKKSQLRFLDELSNRHVTVHGKWKNPSEYFQPEDPITDKLVRLEERWLRLDD